MTILQQHISDEIYGCRADIYAVEVQRPGSTKIAPKPLISPRFSNKTSPNKLVDVKTYNIIFRQVTK